MPPPDRPVDQRHPDDDELLELLLAPRADAEIAAHVTNCVHCTAELDRLRPMADRVAAELTPTPPPDRLWTAISAQLATPPPAMAAPARPWWRRLAVPVAALLAGLLVGAGIVWWVGDRRAEAGPAVRASVVLDRLPTGGTVGVADLLDDAGAASLRVQATLPSVGDDSYEVWLLGSSGRMVALGTLHDGAGTFTVPVGTDLAQYPTVDISDEPPDGNPAHSGHSVARGVLP
jgi:anti-sigma-K factor RskA